MSPLIQAIISDQNSPNEVLIDALQDEGITVAKVYIVEGRTSNWNDWLDEEWVVGAFISKELADNFALELNKWCFENDVCSINQHSFEKLQNLKHPLDPNAKFKKFGTRYVFYEVDLKG